MRYRAAYSSLEDLRVSINTLPAKFWKAAARPLRLLTRNCKSHRRWVLPRCP